MNTTTNHGAAVPLPAAKPALRHTCTGIAARWCPNCGDCTGKMHDGGHCDDWDCPLHGAKSDHAETGT